MRRAGARRPTALLLAALVSAALLGGCGYAAAARGYGPAGDGAYASPGPAHPTAAEQAATLAATRGYRRELLTDAERLTTDVEHLTGAARSGSLAGAERDELAAQATYDALRGAVAPDSATAIGLDGEAWAVGAARLTGLHAIERDLWARHDTTAAASAAAQLAPLADGVAYALSRDALTPQAILVQVQSQLAWAVGVAAAGREELYSHRDLVDVDASIRSADAAFALTAPLDGLVAPTATALATARFASLAATLERLGDPVARPDASLRDATWAGICAQVDAVDAVVGVVEGHVQGFGSGRPYA